MKKSIPVILLALLLLAGCATLGLQRCNTCGRLWDGVPTVYGMPTEEDIDAQQEGKIRLGGDVINFRFCPECGRRTKRL